MKTVDEGASRAAGEADDADRKLLIQAVIVRIMKSRKVRYQEGHATLRFRGFSLGSAGGCLSS